MHGRRTLADQRSLDELAAIGPPPYAEAAPLLRLQRVTERYGDVAFRPQNRAALIVGALMRGIVTPWEICASCKATSARS